MSQRRIPASGLLFALLALAVQLAFGADVPRAEVVTALDGATTICHADGTSDQAPSPPHHLPDCLVCPLCVSLAAPGIVLLAAGPLLPLPQVAILRRAGLPPPATAPPVAPPLAAQPRGPPVLA
jgi:hypothetical protein